MKKKKREIFLEAYSNKCYLLKVFQVKVSMDITYINQINKIKINKE